MRAAARRTAKSSNYLSARPQRNPPRPRVNAVRQSAALGEGADETDDALAGCREAGIGGAERDPQLPDGAWAEAVTGQHRDVLLFEKLQRKGVGRQPGAAHRSEERR